MNALHSEIDETRRHELNLIALMSTEDAIVTNFHEFLKNRLLNIQVLYGFHDRILRFAPHYDSRNTVSVSAEIYHSAHGETAVSLSDIYNRLPSNFAFVLMDGLAIMTCALLYSTLTDKPELLSREGKVNLFRITVSEEVSDVILYWDTKDKSWCLDAYEPNKTVQYEAGLQIFACRRPQTGTLFS
ncbi:MAG: hypothetical protein RLZZ230_384 [Candidatus Parcubacteria bacterium]|jgi:hypothetical protein